MDPLTPAGQWLAVGLGTLALALEHISRLKFMPCFVFMEELEKLRLEALFWGQSRVVVSGEAETMPSLQGPLQ